MTEFPNKITKALHAIMEEVSHVPKHGENKFHGYKYTGEVDLLEKLRPSMLKHGLLLIPSISSVRPIDEYGNTHIQIAYTLAHRDGEVWPHPIMAAGCGGDRNKTGVGDKGLYKAITGANKYFLLKLFNIATGDDPEDDTQDSKQSRHPVTEYHSDGYMIDIPLKATSVLKLPPTEDLMIEAVSAISELAAITGWNELYQFWQNNLDFFDKLKDENKVLFDAVKAKVMSKRPKSEKKEEKTNG